MRAQGREDDWKSLASDADAVYDEEITIDLDKLVPLAARPHSPDNVETVEKIGPIKVDQVAIGSCTNSSYMDMMKVAAVLKGKTVHPDVSLVIAPGSKQVLTMLAKNGALADMVAAGARILESACGRVSAWGSRRRRTRFRCGRLTGTSMAEAGRPLRRYISSARRSRWQAR